MAQELESRRLEHTQKMENYQSSLQMKVATSIPYLSKTPQTTIGRYEIIYPIASGGMASVYTGRLSGMAGFERLFAIKVIHPHLAAERSFIEMFLDEARLAGRIHHPNVAEIFEVGEENGLYYMVGELVLGRDLKRLAETARKKGKIIPRPLIASLLSDIAAGLHEAHELRDEDGEPSCLVHRDISTRNILISYKGYAKLIDFGVAWARGRLSHTRDGSQKGKIGYMPPEQLLGKPIDRRADIYALGIVLYTAVVGTHPFPYYNEGEQIVKMLEGNFVRPRAVNPAIEEDIETVILKAMSTDPNERYATAQEMGKALAAYADAHIQGDAAEQMADLMRELFKEEIIAHDEKIKSRRKKDFPTGSALSMPVRTKDETVPFRVTEVMSTEGARENGIQELRQRTPSKERKIGMVTLSILLCIIAGTIYISRDKGPTATPLNNSPFPAPTSTSILSEAAAPPPTSPIQAHSIVISLVGLLPNSIVYLNDQETALPIVAPLSAIPVRLRIETLGYHRFETLLIPDRNQTVHVIQKRVSKSASPSHKQKKTEVRKSPEDNLQNKNLEKKRDLDEWEANPFI